MMRRWPYVFLLSAAGWVLWTVGAYFLGGRRHRAESAWFIFTALTAAVVWMNARGEEAARTTQNADRPAGGFMELALTLASSIVVYWPAVGIGLLSDDYVLLARPISTVLDPLAWEHFRPVPLVIWKAIYPSGGSVALHFLNIALHGVNAWMLWRLAWRLGHRPEVAGLVAAIFLFFPAAVEPVAWNSGIFDVAAVFFGLLFLHGAMASTITAQALGVGAFVAAMLCKETAVVLPAIAVVVAMRTCVAWRMLAASMALAVTYAALRVLAGANVTAAVVPGGRPVGYALKESLVRPFATLGAPWTRTELLEWPGGPFVLGVVPVAILLALILTYSFRPRAGLRPLTNVAWVLLGTAPLAGFFFVSDQLEGSRYLYLPLCGWSLFLGDLANRMTARRAGPLIVRALLAATVGFGFWGVRHHLEPWRESAALRDTLLADARLAVREARCSSATFENVPDVHEESAQLFRNGFDEAVRGAPFDKDGTPCRFVWTGLRFVRP